MNKNSNCGYLRDTDLLVNLPMPMAGTGLLYIHITLAYRRGKNNSFDIRLHHYFPIAVYLLNKRTINKNSPIHAMGMLGCCASYKRTKYEI